MSSLIILFLMLLTQLMEYKRRYNLIIISILVKKTLKRYKVNKRNILKNSLKLNWISTLFLRLELLAA